MVWHSPAPVSVTRHPNQTAQPCARLCHTPYHPDGPGWCGLVWHSPVPVSVTRHPIQTTPTGVAQPCARLCHTPSHPDGPGGCGLVWDSPVPVSVTRHPIQTAPAGVGWCGTALRPFLSHAIPQGLAFGDHSFLSIKEHGFAGSRLSDGMVSLYSKT